MSFDSAIGVLFPKGTLDLRKPVFVSMVQQMSEELNDVTMVTNEEVITARSRARLVDYVRKLESKCQFEDVVTGLTAIAAFRPLHTPMLLSVIIDELYRNDATHSIDFVLGAILGIFEIGRWLDVHEGVRINTDFDNSFPNIFRIVIEPIDLVTRAGLAGDAFRLFQGKLGQSVAGYIQPSSETKGFANGFIRMQAVLRFLERVKMSIRCKGDDESSDEPGKIKLDDIPDLGMIVFKQILYSSFARIGTHFQLDAMTYVISSML